MQGKVIKFFEAKRYGFVRPENEQEPDVFFHYTCINAPVKYKKFNVEDLVTYDIGDGPNGKQAVNVTLLKSASPRERR